MSNDSPAAILFDELGNPIGVVQDADGYYRLLVEDLPTKVAPTVSFANSSVTPLPSLGIFQGTSEDISEFVSIDVTVIADTDSAVDGLLFEWSQDNVTWGYTDGGSFTILAGTGQNYSPK